MIKSASRPIFHLLLLALFCLAAAPVLAAELQLIDGEYRYYENGELVSHQTHLRALPDGEQTAITMAVAAAEPTEANPERISWATAEALRIFEIQPDPGTDEKIGDPVCVVSSFQSEVSTEIVGAINAASASAGGWGGTAESDADENIPSASASTSAPEATISVDPLSGDLFIENEFASITVSGDDADNSTGDHQFIALIGDSIRLRVGSYAASAAVYPDSAVASAASQMGAELQINVLDCQLSLTALVDTGEGSIQADPDQGSYQFGDEVQLTATPEEGWSFVGWSGDAAGTDNPLQLTIANNTEVFASFEINTYTVTAEVGSGNGQITPATQDVDHGATASFTITPDPSWSVTSVTGDNCTPELDGDDQWVAPNITGACTVTANFEINTYTIGGTLSGLAAGNSVTLQNNNSDDLTLTVNGEFTFSTALADLSDYEVTVLTQPGNPSQTCTVANATGTLAGADVANVEVTCSTDTFTVGGTVSGLEGEALVLQNNGGDDLAINADGDFTFTTPLADGSDYEVSVLTQPTNPSQTCEIARGSGTLQGDDVTDVAVTCATPALGFDRDVIAFGNLDAETEASGEVTLTANDEAPVTISEITDPDEPFAVTGGSCLPVPTTLEPGENCTIEVTYAPGTETAQHESSFEIISDAPSSPNQVQLSGQSFSAIPVPINRSATLIALALLLLMAGWWSRHAQQAGETRTKDR